MHNDAVETAVEELDPKIINAALGGDVAAFGDIVRTYQAAVWRYLTHLLRDPHLAEDVTQDTFIRAYRALRSFRHRAKFSTWLFQIAHNAGLDAIRSAERRRRAMARLEPVAPGGEPDVRTELRGAIDSLSPKLREAVLVIEVLGLSYREAAEVLRVPEGTMKSRVFAARERLVEWFGEGVADAL